MQQHRRLALEIDRPEASALGLAVYRDALPVLRAHGAIKRDLGMLDEASELLSSVLRVQESQWGCSDDVTVDDACSLCECLAIAGRLDEAQVILADYARRLSCSGLSNRHNCAVQCERMEAKRRRLQKQMLLCAARSPPRSSTKSKACSLQFDEAGYAAASEQRVLFLQ
jgi:hypothetical protein